MSQQAKRILNAFAIGALAALLLQAINAWADITNEVQTGDWISLKKTGVALAFGVVLAGFRAVQSYVGFVPSPEPDENKTKKP
jgi:TRAP-type C4-dicarboxylate transport system permease small subunit